MPHLGDHARAGLGPVASVAVEAAGRTIGGALAGLAWARGGKAVHPHGAVHAARLVVAGDPDPPPAAVLADRAEHRALVRFSRSLGLPRPIPDLLGMSVRVLDAYGPERHQDFLLVSSVDRAILHHVFVPATDVQQRIYSSSLPFRAGGETFLVGALPDDDSPRPSGEDELDRLARAAATGKLAFHLAVAPVEGRFRPVARIEIGERLPDAANSLRFNPFNCGGGLEPVGWLNRLRDYAYPLSQRAWARRQGAQAVGTDTSTTTSQWSAEARVPGVSPASIAANTFAPDSMSSRVS
jgi:hypothetical protein